MENGQNSVVTDRSKMLPVFNVCGYEATSKVLKQYAYKKQNSLAWLNIRKNFLTNFENCFEYIIFNAVEQ